MGDMVSEGQPCCVNIRRNRCRGRCMGGLRQYSQPNSDRIARTTVTWSSQPVALYASRIAVRADLTAVGAVRFASDAEPLSTMHGVLLALLPVNLHPYSECMTCGGGSGSLAMLVSTVPAMVLCTRLNDGTPLRRVTTNSACSSSRYIQKVCGSCTKE